MRTRDSIVVYLLALVIALPAGWITLDVGLALLLPIAARICPRLYAPYLDVDLNAMGNFWLDPVRGVDADIPTQFRSLDGQRVVMTCFVYQPRPGRTPAVAQLVYGALHKRGPPRIQERVLTVVPSGQNVSNYPISDLVRAYGVLHVGVMRDADGGITSVYRLDLHRVESFDAQSSLQQIGTDPRDTLGRAFWPTVWTLTLLELLLFRAGFLRFQRAIHRRERAREGRCPVCGYDLRASGERCPECGAHRFAWVAFSGRGLTSSWCWA